MIRPVQRHYRHAAGEYRHFGDFGAARIELADQPQDRDGVAAQHGVGNAEPFGGAQQGGGRRQVGTSYATLDELALGAILLRIATRCESVREPGHGVVLFERDRKIVGPGDVRRDTRPDA